MKYHLTLERMATIKKSMKNKFWRWCREKGTLVHCWWKSKLIHSIWRTIWMFLKQLQTELPYNPEIPLLNTYLEKTKPLVWKDTCIPTFIAALFTIAKIWKQYKYPSTDKQDKEDVVYTYTHTHTHTHTHTQEYDSPVKNNEVMPFVKTWADLEIIILSEVCQKEKDIYSMISLTCGI